jgi:hypothetical protein
MVRENPKPYRTGNIIVHRLICSKNGCGYWNRDVNGATNIYKIAYNAINKKEIPNYLSRSKNLSGRRTTKTKIYTLCEGQTLLIFWH